MSWQDLKKKIDAEAAATVTKPPLEVVKAIHYQHHDQDAGTAGLAFGTWYYAVNDVRYVSIYLYDILRLSMNDGLSGEQIKILFKQMIPPVAEFTGYSGYHTLWQFVQEVVKEFNDLEDCEAILELCNSLFQYASNLNAWLHHYMPWRIGYLFPHQTPEEIREMVAFVGQMQK